ncbi:hypothetical protein RCL1_002274 [Eukaryota sp. TZLM3-RCL]
MPQHPTVFNLYVAQQKTEIVYYSTKKLSNADLEKVVQQQSRDQSEICRSLVETGQCRNQRCGFAHNSNEIRGILKPVGFRRSPCKNFHGSPYLCLWGLRCKFQHFESQKDRVETLDISENPFAMIKRPVQLPLVKCCEPSVRLCDFLQGLSCDLNGTTPIPKKSQSKRLPIFREVCQKQEKTKPKPKPKPKPVETNTTAAKIRKRLGNASLCAPPEFQSNEVVNPPLSISCT